MSTNHKNSWSETRPSKNRKPKNSHTHNNSERLPATNNRIQQQRNVQKKKEQELDRLLEAAAVEIRRAKKLSMKISNTETKFGLVSVSVIEFIHSLIHG